MTLCPLCRNQDTDCPVCGHQRATMLYVDARQKEAMRWIERNMCVQHEGRPQIQFPSDPEGVIQLVMRIMGYARGGTSATREGTAEPNKCERFKKIEWEKGERGKV